MTNMQVYLLFNVKAPPETIQTGSFCDVDVELDIFPWLHTDGHLSVTLDIVDLLWRAGSTHIKRSICRSTLIEKFSHLCQ